jgi:predicted protein tyrosine phosphatase
MMEIGSKILVSCDYGASRSPALTYVIIADALGQGREKEALKLVLKIRPEAMPNSMVVLLGDELLERSGALMEALREFNAELGNIEDYFVV